MNKIDWSDSEALGCYHYDLAKTMMIAVLKWKAHKTKRGCTGDALPGAVHLKFGGSMLRSFERMGMKQDFAEMV